MKKIKNYKYWENPREFRTYSGCKWDWPGIAQTPAPVRNAGARHPDPYTSSAA